MNRPIKFMAWDKEEKRMYAWEELCELDKDGFEYLFDILKGESRLKPYEFTGLLDKDGKEIYEGHILAHPIAQNRNEAVRVIQGKFGWEFHLYNDGFYGWEKDDGTHTSPPLKIVRKEWEHIDDCKVIGHIAEEGSE